MIFRISERVYTPHGPLSKALGLPETVHEGLAEHTLVAYWPDLGSCTQEGEQAAWTAARWARHLDDPLLENPFAASPQGDSRAIFQFEVRLEPGDRTLSSAEWSEVAYRLACVAGIESPGEGNGCRWVAVQGQPGRLDLIANLIRLDGTWQSPPSDLLQRFSSEARRIEGDLQLMSPPGVAQPQGAARPLPIATTQLATVLAQLADEQCGPLAAVRGLIEHTAHRIGRQPGAANSDTAHRLELIAGRLHGIQQDLDTTATSLNVARRPSAAVPAAGVGNAAIRRSR